MMYNVILYFFIENIYKILCFNYYIILLFWIRERFLKKISAKLISIKFQDQIFFYYKNKDVSKKLWVTDHVFLKNYIEILSLIK